MTGSGDDDASSTDEQDPLEDVLGEETLSGPDESESFLPDDDETSASPTPDESATNPNRETLDSDRESDQQTDTNSERSADLPPDSTDQRATAGDASSTGGTQSPEATEGRQQSSRQGRQRPPAVGSQGQPRPEPETDESGGEWQLFVKDIVTSVLAVLILGGYLFAISGIWPPMVAIESESMEPNMNVDDLVFLMDNDRFAPSAAEAGVVTARAGAETGYETYGQSGDVIVFEPDGNGRTTPIIHRAMFWVDAGENWCQQADPQYLGGLSPSNDDCVADNAGFITKGDNNNRYDQAATQAENPVKPEWVVGTAEVRLPRLGWFRLQFQ
jgi:signal peptidase